MSTLRLLDEAEVFLEDYSKEDRGDADSPIEEVNLTVPTTDTPDMRMLTVRTWVIGLLICGFLAFVNQFFWFRSSPITISALAGQIVSLYLGRMMATWLPDKKIGPIELNPGPFNIKEHVLITVFAGCGSAFGRGNAEAIQLVTLLNIPKFFNKSLNFGVAVLLVSTTQTLGYGMAGLLRKYVVDPPHMWWPSTMVDVALFRALHEKEPSRGLSRIQFFLIAAVISFAWYIVPDYFFTTITSLSWICWVYKDSVTAQQLGSGINGLGFGSIALDWATISAYLSSPLSTPWFTLVNVYVGFLIAAYIITPLCYWYDVYNAQNFPIISNKLFLLNGNRYNVKQVLDAGGLDLDLEKYNAYGPPELSTSYAIIHWGLVFAYITSAFTHVCLWNGKDIYHRFMSSRLDGKYKPDIHTQLMQYYPEIPSWWFWALLLVNVALSLFMMKNWEDTFQISSSMLLLAIGMSCAFTLPIAIITATTNQFEGPGALCDFFYGYLAPGRVVGLNSFRVYAAGSVVQSVVFLRDFKLAHYMKIPPRNMFLVQVVGTLLAGFVNVSCAYWLYEAEPLLCAESGDWTCPAATNGFSVATIWGLIGTRRMFGDIGRYKNMTWMFLFGAIAPIPFWALAKMSPKLEFLKWVHLPVILSAVKPWPPATPVNFNSWFLVGFMFNFVIFRHRRSWWKRYNYVLSAALDTGIAIAGPLLFFTLQYEKKGHLAWWGNSHPYVDHCPLAICPTARGINVTSTNPLCPVM
ncbi:hypothetical protein MPTK1_3g20520 [Marchantia polymorpha subsp. ruderalis]|uniref:Oligopeptide transporter n=2 Tax=Marchantia polymorpha TaxID=3197 RepID=A0AAF6B2Y2_MARPO|nr:hypothetical protein MARPO_0149s0017 [Marchantia polymorpha]BBN06365.1 hypothetical protein Mp_3g20520 [Marchantia polymorpha subsp. ruderalis]PTQ29022.1 hypothetical protein MARPO_0149s0017 [Marchantia polymorpha]PTQ29023.1 hypothetical protein MARPO_0149s0017 [Marchantia polymorpha]BBN06366.1 hypothetical protein Mp_3g20520 [Marchantia polymorpha subsp. ruderalis]|eukprot:PTQ29021.1 hypothetical protein MARPO_0149s0017 [Marchantia polymorpha]